MNFEPVHKSAPGLIDAARDTSILHLGNALIAFLFAASAPVAIIIGVGLKGGLTEPQIASWIFGGFAINGLLTILMSTIYRQPLAFFWTISGSVLVGPALVHATFPEVIGAFLGTGILLLILGLTGAVKKIMAMLPMPIIMAMVAGVFLSFGLDWIKAMGEEPWIAVTMTAAFILLSTNSRVAKRLPPMIGALVVGIIAIVITGTFNPGTDFEYSFVTP